MPRGAAATAALPIWRTGRHRHRDVPLSGCARLPGKDRPADTLFKWVPGPLRKLVFDPAAKRVLFASRLRRLLERCGAALGLRERSG